MERPHPRVLIAAPAAVIRQLGSILVDDIEVVGGETLDEAVRKLHELPPPNLLIVCYAFDEVRPFRLLRYVLQESRSHIATILVRALAIRMGETQEAQIRESYKSLGVDAFFNLHDEIRRTDQQVALQKFRDAVWRLLPRRPSGRRRAFAKRADSASQ